MWILLFVILGFCFVPLAIIFIHYLMNIQSSLDWTIALALSPYVGIIIGLVFGAAKQIYDIKYGLMTQRRRKMLALTNLLAIFVVFIIFCFSKI